MIMIHEELFRHFVFVCYFLCMGLWLIILNLLFQLFGNFTADTLLKYAGSVIATSLSICLVHLPFLHYLYKGNLEATAKIWSTEGLQIGLSNALAWLLYAASVYQRDGGPDVLVSCAWSAGVMLCCLMVICSHKRKLKTVSTLPVSIHLQPFLTRISPLSISLSVHL